MNKQWAGILLCAMTLAGCSGEPADVAAGDKSANAPRAVPVIAQQVVLEAEQVRLQAVGTSRARRSVTLYPNAAGDVTAVNFTTGQHVESGMPLLELDARDERFAVELAGVRLEEAERLYRRYTQSPKSVTPSDLDSARSAVEAARIELNRARVALDDMLLKAPFSGHVGLTDIDVGAHVDSDTAVTTLDDRSSLFVRFEVPESLIERIEKGGPVTIAPWRGGTPITGHIVEIDSRIDSLSRTFTVRAEIPNPGDRLRPGMSFRVELALDGNAYPVVPEVSVQWGSDGSFVWAVEAMKATRRPVTIVQRRNGGRVLVDADLKAGEAVVREGVQRMREGTRVSFEETSQPQSATAE